ncbi:MAG: hypothetical protein HYZ79_02495, partial [Candidatus Melainabacteria bacterium]|nr:hypothetical protein [Candidatus Melainabacteria bacterium]
FWCDTGTCTGCSTTNPVIHVCDGTNWQESDKTVEDLSRTINGTTLFDNSVTVGSSVSVSAGSNKITNVADPTSDQDAATKKYVDDSIPASSTLFASTANVSIDGMSSTETSIIGSGVGSLTIGANTLSVGDTLRIKAAGQYNTDGAAGSGTIKLKFGGTTLITSTTQALPNQITGSWSIDCIVTIRAIGASGTAQPRGLTILSTTSGTVSSIDMGVNSTTVDTTAANAVDLTWQWSGSHDGGETWTCTNFTLEKLTT